MAAAHKPLHTAEMQWHSKPRALRVICIGAGPTGLLVAYKLKRQLENYELAVYEKNAGVGGVWFENRYPGCACDVPAHIYTYSFEANPDWSSYYAPSAEIQKYFENFASKYDLNQYIQLETKVTSAIWDEAKGLYNVTMERDKSITHDWAHVVINGTGILNNWKWPAIAGLHEFRGTLMHSAAWNQNVSLNDQTVAVIGTGSSAIQIVPRLQPQVQKLVNFMRSTTWISPPWVADQLEQNKADSQSPSRRSSEQYYYSEEEKLRFRENPEGLLTYRKNMESKFNSMFETFLRDSPASLTAEDTMRTEMIRRIGPGYDELKSRLIPSWPPGCRRITPGVGYLEALVKENVDLVYDDISRVTSDGLVDKTGRFHKVDAIVCATGFDMSFKPPFEIHGVGGVTMAEMFTKGPQVYLSMAVPRFPNYFCVNNALGNWAVGTALNAIEACVDYITTCIDRIQRDQIRALEVKEEPVKQLIEYAQEWHKGSVWGADCKSWYKNNVRGGKVWAWCGSVSMILSPVELLMLLNIDKLIVNKSLHFLKTLQFVRWEHYDIRYDVANMWAFLGNGQVIAEIAKDRERLTPYIRSSDVRWYID